MRADPADIACTIIGTTVVTLLAVAGWFALSSPREAIAQGVSRVHITTSRVDVDINGWAVPMGRILEDGPGYAIICYTRPDAMSCVRVK